MDWLLDHPCVRAWWRTLGKLASKRPEVLFGHRIGCGAEPILRGEKARAIRSGSASPERMNEPRTSPLGTASGFHEQRRNT